MKNTSLPRLFANAALVAAFVAPSAALHAQVKQQSYLRNVPSEIEREDPRVQAIIDRSEDYFRKGELNLKDGKREAARRDFDESVDTILKSGMDVRSHPKLQNFYVQLVERVYRLEVPTAQSGPATHLASLPGGAAVVPAAQQQDAAAPAVGFAEQKFEPSPRDVLAKFELTKDESEVSDEQVAKLDEEINTLDFKVRPHPLVQGFINYYQGRGRGTMETGLRRSGQYTALARKIFREEGVPEDIVWLGQVESAWRPTARSWAAASGLWQFIPGTGARFGLRQTAYVDERNGFEKATRASARYLKFLANRYNGDWELAMGAYNTGEGNIDRAIRRAGSRSFWDIYPYIAQETRNYVPNILAVILIAKNPEKYGFRNVQRMSPLAYDTISVPSSTSLHLIASLTESSVDYIRALNPELRRDVTPPGEAFHLRVPPRRGAVAVEMLKRIPVEQRGRVQLASKSYERPVAAGAPAPTGGNVQFIAARGGETVAQFAARVGASVEDVAKLNTRPASATLKAGERLRVPSTGKAAPATRRR